MNCKPGDLAIFMKSNAGNEGKIVRCTRFLGRPLNRLGIRSACDDIWETDTVLPMSWGPMEAWAADFQLRPIRGEEGNESWFVAAPLSKVKEVV